MTGHILFLIPVLTDVILWQGESFQQVQPVGDVAQLGLVWLLQAEQDQVDRCGVVGCKVVVGAVIHRVPWKLQYAEIPHTYGEGNHWNEQHVNIVVEVIIYHCQ